MDNSTLTYLTIIAPGISNLLVLRLSISLLSLVAKGPSHLPFAFYVSFYHYHFAIGDDSSHHKQCQITIKGLNQ